MKEIKIKDSNEIIYYEKLPCGLDIYMYPSKNVKNFNIELMTKYGAKMTEFKRKDEKEYHKTPNGVAHFLEHITFHLDGIDADELFSPYGAYINAFTNYERTAYIVENNSNFNYVYTPYYTEETVNNEKGIIKEESKRCDDDPGRKFWKYVNDGLFSKCNYRKKVVGALDEIESITLDDINNAYNTFYHPGNMILLIGGNFNIDNALKVINKRMNTFTFYKFKGIDVKIPDEPVNVNESKQVIKENVLNERVSYTIKIPKESINKTGLSIVEYDNYLNLLLASNLGSTSDYAEELLEKDIVVNNSSFYTDFIDDYVIIYVMNSPKEGKTNEFIKITEKYLNNMKISMDDYKRKFKVYISSYLLSFDDPGRVIEAISDDLLYYNHVIDDYIKIGKSFTEDKGKKILKSIDFNNKSITIMQPDSCN